MPAGHRLAQAQHMPAGYAQHMSAGYAQHKHAGQGSSCSRLCPIHQSSYQTLLRSMGSRNLQLTCCVLAQQDRSILGTVQVHNTVSSQSVLVIRHDIL